MARNLTNQTIIITGASSGLGEATARMLSAEGASVVLGAMGAVDFSSRMPLIQNMVKPDELEGGFALAVSFGVMGVAGWEVRITRSIPVPPSVPRSR